jgi:hypothetical protein
MADLGSRLRIRGDPFVVSFTLSTGEFKFYSSGSSCQLQLQTVHRRLLYQNNVVPRRTPHIDNMASPPEITCTNLTGKFSMNKTLGDNIEPMLVLQGISWPLRKAIGLTTPAVC